jgi:hypothetical protein
MAHVHEYARAIANHGARLDAPALAYRLARLYADYNHIHPFRYLQPFSVVNDACHAPSLRIVRS